MARRGGRRPRSPARTRRFFWEPGERAPLLGAAGSRVSTTPSGTDSQAGPFDHCQGVPVVARLQAVVLRGDLADMLTWTAPGNDKEPSGAHSTSANVGGQQRGLDLHRHDPPPVTRPAPGREKTTPQIRKGEEKTLILDAL